MKNAMNLERERERDEGPVDGRSDYRKWATKVSFGGWIPEVGLSRNGRKRRGIGRISGVIRGRRNSHSWLISGGVIN